MIAIHKDSLVLRKDVISRLTDAFSKKPRGQAFVNQSSEFMNPILTNVIISIEGFIAFIVFGSVPTIGDFLSSILRIAPKILTDNPYNPPGHDISKFMDFKTDPQSYRNKWIVYFVTEIFNSHDNGDNFFNHVVLLILLFRYLTLLPTDAIDSQQIIITSQTTPNCIADAKALIIKTYACHQLLEIDVAREQGINLHELRDDIDSAAHETRIKNEAFDADAVAATTANARDADARADAAAAVVLATNYKNNKKTRAAAAPVQAARDAMVEGNQDAAAAAAAAPQAAPIFPPQVAPAAAAPIFPPQVAPAAAAAAADPAAVAASVARLRGRRAAPAAAAAAAAMVDYAADAAAAAVPRKSVRGSRSGGTIRNRNPQSPKKTNNHTRKNKYKRNNKIKNKKQKSSPKYRKVNPSSRSGSQSNKKKSKSKLPHKNVTFKRRRYNNK
jgi:hypothetical protein